MLPNVHLWLFVSTVGIILFWFCRLVYLFGLFLEKKCVFGEQNSCVHFIFLASIHPSIYPSIHPSIHLSIWNVWTVWAITAKAWICCGDVYPVRTHNLSSWPDRVPQWPHITAVFACFAIQIARVHNSSSIRSRWERKDMMQDQTGFWKGNRSRDGNFFVEVDREGELCRQAKEIYIFPTLWLLIAPSMHYYTSFCRHDMIQM